MPNEYIVWARAYGKAMKVEKTSKTKILTNLPLCKQGLLTCGI
jgi:hypothetical protein